MEWWCFVVSQTIRWTPWRAGVPVDATVEIYWPGMVLHFHCSFMHPLRQWVEVPRDDLGFWFA